MNIKTDNLNEDEMLKEAYEQIVPDDSWESLRDRIGNRLAESQLNLVSRDSNNSVLFWRNLSLAMAACFIVTAGILIYTMGLNQGVHLNNQNTSANSHKLISHDDMTMLTDAFSQVKQLFGGQSRWIVIGSGNESQVGLAENPHLDVGTQKLIVIRLAVSSETQNLPKRYYDVVTYGDQKTKLQLPLINETALVVDLKPVIKVDGTINVEIAAETSSGSQSKSKSAIASEAFTPLLNMNVNGDWIRIDGVGRHTSADGKMML